MNIVFQGEIPTYGLAGNRLDAVDIRELNESETVKTEVDEEPGDDHSTAEYVSSFIK